MKSLSECLVNEVHKTNPNKLESTKFLSWLSNAENIGDQYMNAWLQTVKQNDLDKFAKSFDNLVESMLKDDKTRIDTMGHDGIYSLCSFFRSLFIELSYSRKIEFNSKYANMDFDEFRKL